MVVLLILLVLVTLQWIRKARQENHLLRYRYRFFALRDRLRRIAIEDRKLGKNWLYPYLDVTISRTIDILPYLSAWQALALLPVARERSKRMLWVTKQLHGELQKPANRAFQAVYSDMWNDIAHQISDRHFVVRGEISVLERVSQGIKKVVVAIRNRERRSFESVLLTEPKIVKRPAVVDDYAMSMATR